MLICFDSPTAAKVKNQEKLPHRNGLSSPLIPCPSSPFDLVSSQRGDDPFEPQFTDPYGLKPRFDNTRKTPERSLLAPPVMIHIPAIDGMVFSRSRPRLPLWSPKCSCCYVDLSKEGIMVVIFYQRVNSIYSMPDFYQSCYGPHEDHRLSMPATWFGLSGAFFY